MGHRILPVEDDANFRARVLLGVLAVLLLAGFAAGCGLVSDQTKQEAKKVESKAKQAKQEVKKKIESEGQQAKQDVKKKIESEGQRDKQKVEAAQEDLQKKVDDLEKKVGAGQEDLQKKVDDVQKDVNDLQKKVNELLKMAHALEQQRQKE